MPPRDAAKDAAAKRFRVRRVVGAAEADLERELLDAAEMGYLPSEHLSSSAIVLANGDLLLVFERDPKAAE